MRLRRGALVFEELVTDPEGLLTTSFLSADHPVKDNRIEPAGRIVGGPFDEFILPVGTGDDPAYQGTCGCSMLTYAIPLAQIPGAPAAVRATIYYPSIPPRTTCGKERSKVAAAIRSV
jgi:hypothetical protein